MTRPTPLQRTAKLLRPFNLLVFLLYLFLLFPSIIVMPISLNGSGQLVFPPINPSLDLYAQFLSDPAWMAATWQSLKVALLSLAISLAVGIPAAFALSRAPVRWLGWTEGLFIGPMLVPTVLTALGSYILLSRLSLAGSTLGLVVAHAAFVMPFVFITTRAGLRQLPILAETAARVMGAGWLRIFWRVTLPQLKKSIVSASLLAFLMSFDEVVISYFIVNTQTVTLPVRMYSSIQWEVSPIIAAISTLLTLFSIVACLASYALGDDSSEEGR